MTVLAELEAKRSMHGPWTAHNIKLAKDIYTISAEYQSRAHKRAELYAGLKRTISKRSLRGCKVLDLGFLECGISIYSAETSKFELLDSNIAPQPHKCFAQTGEPTLWECEWGHQTRDVRVAYPCKPDSRPWAHPSLNNT